MWKRAAAILVAWCALCLAAEVSGPEQAALARISADSLRGNLSFLASDALEGRATPSLGLAVAAEFIAAQFRRLGLAGIAPDGGYFQRAELVQITPNLTGFEFSLKTGSAVLPLTSDEVFVRSATQLGLTDAEVLRLPDEGEPPAMEGRVVAGDAGRFGTEAALRTLSSRKPALILLTGDQAAGASRDSYLEERNSGSVPVFRIANVSLEEALAARERITVSVHLAAPLRKDATVNNVGGILRGSDPALKEQYVLLTAHYDHLEMLPAGNGDRIYNGANDNGSGTVSVIEIAAALAALPTHPRRSILFLALYGEEWGLLGARYYTNHPLAPLRDTVAVINLEQLGRTDDRDGPKVGQFAFTGPSFSDIPGIFSKASAGLGVKVYTRPDGDAFFDRSDNYAFALAGVVAHTAVVAFEYPDYHEPGDEWPKIDYENMAKVDRALAAGVLRIANADGTPTWSDSKETERFREVNRGRRVP